MNEFDLRHLPAACRPLSPWSYFGLGILYALPLLGWIFLIVHAIGSANINRRNYARSYFCVYVLAIILGVLLTSVFTLTSAADVPGHEYVAVLATAPNRSSSVTFNIGAPNIAEINAAYPLDTDAAKAANTAPYFHALSASPTDFSLTCDGQTAEGGAYVQLYDSTTESFTTASAIPPQGAGYIELVCMVPTTWQQIGVTYTPTFVSGKTLNFTINASDLTKA